MGRCRYILFVAVGMLCFSIIEAQYKKFRIEKSPVWITVNTINYSSSQLDHEAEGGFVDLAYEKQVNLQSQSTYYRKTVKIISEAGVQNGSEISINFDPSYEQLIFHNIQVIRGKEIFDKLQPGKIKIIQQETELDRYIYDQSLSAILLLEDVRKGDIIEYSYTITGFNTIFMGRYTDMYDVGFTVPIYNMYYKMIVPKGREIAIKNSQTNIQPEIKNSSAETTYEWKLNNVPSLHIQESLPSWYDPYPMIILSEYKSWKEVNDWAMSLFPMTKNISLDLRKKINEILINDTNTEKRVLAALRFVQDDIRYMGIEMGENSHRPFLPNKVFAQRFGDCKDKSYLLCTMLRAMNIEADPVLINSHYKKTINSWLPAPTAFDHTTVRVKLNNKIFYFDPTISFQRGNINDISYPDYQTGLVISDSTNSLIDIPLQENGFVNVKEIFTIPDMNGTAQLKVITLYSGSFADDIRNSFSNNSNYQMLSQFKDYYALYFEKAKSDSLSIEDNDTTGVFTTYEFYTIPDLWKIENGNKKVEFESFVINGVLKKPKEINRRMPFHIRFPAWYKEEIEINVPEEWNAKESSDEITCDQFFMKTNFSYSYKKVLLQYEYKSYKDNVSPEQIQSFLNKYTLANNSLSYELTWKIDARKKSDGVYIDNTMNIIVSLIILVFGSIGIIVFKIARKNRY